MPTGIDVARAEQLLAEGAVLLDVLPEPIFFEEHLPGAQNVPLEILDRAIVDTFDTSRPVVVYCHDQH